MTADALITLLSFLFCTGLVAVLTWWWTRRDDHASSAGYFLAGRSLSYPLIAGSLLLTNLSTEQLVGLNGDAYTYGLCVMVWEVVAVIALVFMAWFFLPRFLKSGVATVPEFLELRYGESTQFITNVIFLIAYVVILLPLILFTGAVGLIDILDWEAVIGEYNFLGEQVSDRLFAIIVVGVAVGIIGSIYALYGGLRTVAVSDTLNGVLLLSGGFLITYFALRHIGGGNDVLAGMQQLYTDQQARFNSIGSNRTNVPFGAIFSGIFLLNLFYWTTNQQIIQRTFGASSLAEGQKGVFLTGLLKLLGPLYLVVPGIIAYQMFSSDNIQPNQAYGKLVNAVLPNWLNGFFAAAMLGAILSSFNSALNSSCTLFSLGIYKKLKPQATDQQTVFSSTVFGTIIAIIAMAVAPLLNGQDSIFGYLQKMNGMYFIPIFAVVLVAMVSKRTQARTANLALLMGFVIIFAGYFIPPFSYVVESLSDFHFLGIVFGWLIVFQIVGGELDPRETEYVQVDAKAVDLQPWKYSKPVGFALIAMVIAIYLTFADFKVLSNKLPVTDEKAVTDKATAADLETSGPLGELAIRSR